MKILSLISLLFLSTFLKAQVIPQPAQLKTGDDLSILSLIALPSEIPVVQKSLESIPQVQMEQGPGATLEIKIATTLGFPKFKMDESYTVTTTTSSVTISAANEFGALHALETLKQLFQLKSGLSKKLSITDGPRFPWRGLLVDVARNWVSLETLRKQIDLMAAAKLNVLHLHLSDDQAFRVESKKFPKLHNNNWDEKFYTQKELKELTLYAAQRGIRVVPEFDVPGHTTSLIAAYPELASLKGSGTPSQKYGPHDEAMNPINESTYAFLEVLFTEMTGLFPDEFFHVGGDEVSGKHWLANPEIAQFMKEQKIENTTELQFRFTKRMEALIQKLGKKMIAWDEVLKEQEPLTSVAQIWRGPKFASQALKSSMPVIFSYGYYLDLQLSSERHYSIDPAGEMGLKSDPDLLWGGEACMWSERITDETTTHRIWPRAFAVAERLWSPRTVVDVQDFYARQASLSEVLGFTDYALEKRIQIETGGKEGSSAILKSFFDLLEPGKFYSQHRSREITTKTKWSLWVDIMPSESLKTTKVTWAFEKWMKTKNASDLKVLEEGIASWALVSAQMSTLETLEFNEKKDLLSLAKDIGSLSRMAVDALEYLKTGDRPPKLWLMDFQTKLTMMGQIRAGMQPAMHALVLRLTQEVARKNPQLVYR